MNKLVNFVICYRFEFNINGCSGSLQCFHTVGWAVCNRPCENLLQLPWMVLFWGTWPILEWL